MAQSLVTREIVLLLVLAAVAALSWLPVMMVPNLGTSLVNARWPAPIKFYYCTAIFASLLGRDM